MKVLELFSGIRALSKALEKLEIDYECVDSVEIDKYAIKSQNAIYGTNFEPQDIREWDKQLEVDLIMHGSPCQDFSLAGKQAGGDLGSGTRSSLLYETIRIVAKLKPKYVIWENVKNVLSKKHRHNFGNYLKEMEQLGYTNYYQVLNAKDYGIPQNRERVFTISILGEHDIFNFPQKQELKKVFKDIVNPEESWEVPDYIIKSFAFKNGDFGKRFTTRGLNDIATCITTKPNWAVITNNYYARDFRKYSITEVYDWNVKTFVPSPLEVWRLMGFDDEDFEKASKVCSNSQLYKQAGNSIVVNVLEAILKNLLEL